MLTRRRFVSIAGSFPLLLHARRLLAQAGTDVTSLGIAESTALLRNGVLSPLELTQAYLDRIARFEDVVNAYVIVTPEFALGQAQVLTVELMRGQLRGPLHGIPIGLKDNIDVTGFPTTAANAMLANRIADEDAPVWTRAHMAGIGLLVHYKGWLAEHGG